jgi:hypothetical protein
LRNSPKVAPDNGMVAVPVPSDSQLRHLDLSRLIVLDLRKTAGVIDNLAKQ